MKNHGYLLLLVFLVHSAFSQTSSPRQIQPADVYRMKNVSKAKISPEGNWIIYEMSYADSVKDKEQSKLFMVSRDGKETITLTEQTLGVNAHDWSPDGKYISFVGPSKKEEETDQIFLMDRRGGEPIQLTHINGDIQSYTWRFDGKKILLVVRDQNFADTSKTKVRKPYEINRFQFKQDYEGYLDNRKTHLYVIDLASKKIDTLTKGTSNETGARFSPDGSSVLYVSNTTADPDRNSNTDIFLLSLNQIGKPLQLTSFKGSNYSAEFSPDGTHIAYVQSSSATNYSMYDQSILAVYNIKTGASTLVSSSLDRSVEDYVWDGDSKHIYALVEDDRKRNVISFDIESLSHKAVTDDEGVYSGIHINGKGQLIALYSDMNTPNEIYVYNGKGFDRTTNTQQDVFTGLKPIYKKGFQSVSDDGTLVSGIIYLPDSASKKLPLILFVHGGPVAQNDYSYDQSHEILAGAGFAVAAVNYRGSSGRGHDFCKAIYADWGNKEIQDLLGAANYLIKVGIADPDKLGIGGWSYGGILTNYMIATTSRFKAAASGAGSSLQLSIYGTDQYAKQYNEELGVPWKNSKKWMDLSFPFFKADQIKTPTLFMASEKDFNVPVAGAEQMYQALRTLGVPTELVIYPNQHHGLKVPSYVVHRFNRYIDWFNTYLK
jgi:dipeptidyl aminopeptidase/acylaminoacyl peptidase